MAVRLLGGAGPFVGGQALLTFAYGVCKEDFSRFAPRLDVGTMADYCSYGPGPKKMILKLWKAKGLNEAEVVARIVWLAKNADAEFAKLGLAFPYQVEDGRRRALTAVDMEHSLCYFSRYLWRTTNCGPPAPPPSTRCSRALSPTRIAPAPPSSGSRASRRTRRPTAAATGSAAARRTTSPTRTTRTSRRRSRWPRGEDAVRAPPLGRSSQTSTQARLS